MKNFIYCLCTIVFIFYSQNNYSQKLYLIQGQSFLDEIDEEGKDLHPLFLYSLDGDSLLIMNELLINNSYIKNIRMYFTYKKIVICYSRILNDTLSFEIIDFNNNLLISHHNVYSKEYMCNSNYVINKTSELNIIVKQVSRDFKKRQLIGINFENHIVKNYIDADMQYYIGDGCQGVGVEDIFRSQQTEKLFLKADYDKDSNLFYYLKPITEFDKRHLFSMPNVEDLKAIDMDFVLPTLKYGQYLIKINTNEFIIMYGKVREYNGRFCKKQYLIYDKNKNKWISKDFKGSYPTLRAFGEWLAGAVVDDIRDLPKNINELQITGKKYRIQERTKLGSPADLRFKEMLMYPYGILYIYNYKTQKYIEFEAIENDERQGDSEILLVQDEIVYYRINDKIYKAQIINGENLGESVLLVQDERVPYIHCAFISGN